jgi:hypothetical protein
MHAILDLVGLRPGASGSDFGASNGLYGSPRLSALFPTTPDADAALSTLEAAIDAVCARLFAS